MSVLCVTLGGVITILLHSIFIIPFYIPNSSPPQLIKFWEIVAATAKLLHLSHCIKSSADDRFINATLFSLLLALFQEPGS